MIAHSLKIILYEFLYLSYVQYIFNELISEIPISMKTVIVNNSEMEFASHAVCIPT